MNYKFNAKDIEPLGYIRWNKREYDIELDHLKNTLEYYAKDLKIEMDPDFQRGHVWTEAQQIAFMEYSLRGGRTGREIIWNCEGWNHRETPEPMTIVDGKQRITAALRFLNDEIPVFGARYSEIEKRPIRPFANAAGFRFQIFDLKREDVLQLYIDLNAGGTPHSPSEIARVRTLLEKEKDNALTRRLAKHDIEQQQKQAGEHDRATQKKGTEK